MVTRRKFPKGRPKRGHGTKGPPKGQPFPKGVSGNPGGRPRKPPPEVLAILLEGNIAALKVLWAAMHSSNEAIRVEAAKSWLKKTTPDAHMLIVPGTKGGPTNVSDVRAQFKERMAAVFGLDARDDGTIEAGPIVDALPAGAPVEE